MVKNQYDRIYNIITEPDRIDEVIGAIVKGATGLVKKAWGATKAVVGGTLKAVGRAGKEVGEFVKTKRNRPKNVTKVIHNTTEAPRTHFGNPNQAPEVKL